MHKEEADDPVQRALPTRRDAVATRAALLAAAAKVFAQASYHDPKVRAICRTAGVNGGAVNRHFGSKKSLYHEVVVRAGRQLIEQEPCPQLKEFDTPEDALRAWMRFHLRLVLLHQASDPVANALITRELANPTDALDDFFQWVVEPISTKLSIIVRAVMGRRRGSSRVLAATNFVHGLCAFQSIGGHILSRLEQPTPHDAASIERRLDLLFPMALAGVQAAAAKDK